MRETESWVFRVPNYEGESLGHYLGRFRRANHLSHQALAQHLGVPLLWVIAWESPSRRRNPTELQLIALSKLMELDREQLADMLPPLDLHLPTRLCGACYAEIPIHRTVWQSQGPDSCDRHKIKLLTACPQCRTGFLTPALWSIGECDKCGLAYGRMHLF